jgi:hypothetical protein
MMEISDREYVRTTDGNIRTRSWRLWSWVPLPVVGWQAQTRTQRGVVEETTETGP